MEKAKCACQEKLLKGEFLSVMFLLENLETKIPMDNQEWEILTKINNNSNNHSNSINNNIKDPKLTVTKDNVIT